MFAIFNGAIYRLPGMHIDTHVDKKNAIKHAGPRSGGYEAVVMDNRYNLYRPLDKWRIREKLKILYGFYLFKIIY